MVPFRSASYTRNASASPFGSVVRPTLAIYRCAATDSRSSPREASSEVAGRHRFEHELGHPDRPLRAAAPDDQRGERQIAAVSGEPGVRPARELGLTSLRVDLAAAPRNLFGRPV